jgi:hypothetical protein
MPEKELEKLLGGYATDTLTESERKALLEAALHDQMLFDALVDEQALKELLRDPAVRRRILAALERQPAATPIAQQPGFRSVIEWFRRPTNLALAGGLATAALAAVVGIRLYEASLRVQDESVATEESRLVTKPHQELAPPVAVEEPTRVDRITPQSPAPASPVEQKRSLTRHAEVPPEGMAQTQKHDRADGSRAKSALPSVEPRQQAGSRSQPEDQLAFGQRTEPETPPKQLQRRAEVSPAPSAVPPAGAPKRNEPTSSASTAPRPPQTSARELFYGVAKQGTDLETRPNAPAGGTSRPEPQTQADETAVAKKEATDSGRANGFGKLGALSLPTTRPLGLRYSLILRGPEGRDIEADRTTAFTDRDEPRLTIETNTRGYLFVWHEPGPGLATLLFPRPPLPSSTEKQNGSAEVQSGTRYVIPLHTGSKLQDTARRGRLLILFSREPGMDLTNLASVVEHSKPASESPLMEQVDPTQSGSPNERAVYVVNPDPSQAARLIVTIPLAQP